MIECSRVRGQPRRMLPALRSISVLIWIHRHRLLLSRNHHILARESDRDWPPILSFGAIEFLWFANQDGRTAVLNNDSQKFFSAKRVYGNTLT
jgi:hypothetical protein